MMMWSIMFITQQPKVCYMRTCLASSKSDHKTGRDPPHEHASPAALSDSEPRTTQPRCMEETHVELSEELVDWEEFDEPYIRLDFHEATARKLSPM